MSYEFMDELDRLRFIEEQAEKLVDEVGYFASGSFVIGDTIVSGEEEIKSIISELEKLIKHQTE